eukprot:TRINITY_DN2780_c0_g1_i3.p1 TRINITY_DN2780_c0_g1~~TRINITY_DN2780_c0_g1_i3.p1  ORF type:complete len:438 (+),score=132.78 TRINITY_DN2780_c0_g1_i3:62-1315(+)
MALKRSLSTLASVVSRSLGPKCSLRHMSVRPALTMLSEDEQMLRDSVAKFAQQSIAPKVREMDSKGELDLTILNGLFENGFMGIEIPTDFGGAGMTFTQSCIVIQELAKVDPAISVIVDIQNTLINTSFRKYASESLQKKYLPRLATDTLGSFCLSEAASGSDAFAMATRARYNKDRGTFSINGSKMWISNAKEAGLFLVFANADPEKGYKGITAFVVDKGTPGLVVGKKEDKLGIRASSTCELNLSDVEVPASQMLGEFGKGYKVAIELLNEGRIGIGAQMVGLAQGAFNSVMPYLHERKQRGQIIADFQGMQLQYAQAATEIEAAQLLMLNAARLKDAGAPFVKEAAMTKLYCSQVAERVASKAVEWFGGVGYTKDFPAEKFFRDSKIGSIYEGTSNIQLVSIAKMLSAEYKPQK